MSPTVTTAAISRTCPKCGTIASSGKISCCGHGGSWFGKCGSARNAKFGHSWDDGIRACRVGQFEIAVAQQLSASRRQSSGASSNVSVGMRSNEGFAASRFSVATTTEAPITTPNTSPITALADTSVALAPKPIICGTETTSTGCIRSSVVISAPKPIIRAVVANLTIIRSMCDAVAKMIKTTPSYSSANTLITGRARCTLLHIVAQISVMIIIY